MSAPKIVDVRNQKVCFPAALGVGKNFLTPGRSGARVRNVRFFPDLGELGFYILRDTQEPWQFRGAGHATDD